MAIPQTNSYVSINPRTQAWVVKELLEVAYPLMHIQNMSGQKATSVPQNNGKIVKFRRYDKLVINTTPISASTTNIGTDVAANYQALNHEDFDVEIKMYGTYTMLDKDTQIFVEDNLLLEGTQRLGSWAGETRETLDWNVLSSATSVYYTGEATTAATVVLPFTSAELRKLSRFLINNDTPKITNILKASTGVGSVPINSAYIALVHTDLEANLLELTDYIPVEKYSNTDAAMPGEIGRVGHIRFVGSTLYKGVNGGGGEITGTPTVRTTDISGVIRANIYNVVVYGKHAYDCTELKGLKAFEIKISRKGEASPSDPYGLLQSMSVQFHSATLITNQKNIVRLVTAVRI